MLRNNDKRLGKAEDSLIRAHTRIDKHDTIFEVLKLDLEYMKKGIDDLKEGQTRLEDQHQKTG